MWNTHSELSGTFSLYKDCWLYPFYVQKVSLSHKLELVSYTSNNFLTTDNDIAHPVRQLPATVDWILVQANKLSKHACISPRSYASLGTNRPW